MKKGEIIQNRNRSVENNVTQLTDISSYILYVQGDKR